MKKVKASLEELEEFENFLIEMDDVLEDFIAKAGIEGKNLDYSLSSLDHLELIILKKLIEKEDAEVLKNRAARYLGEVFRKNVGGKWELCLKDPKYLFLKLPVISGFSDLDYEFCPIAMIKNFMRSKKRGFLKEVVLMDMEYKKKS